METVALFAVVATLSAALVEAYAIRTARANAAEALGLFRFGHLTPKGKRAAGRVCRAAYDMASALGTNQEAYARAWMGDWWERVNVAVELPIKPPPTNGPPSTELPSDGKGESR